MKVLSMQVVAKTDDGQTIKQELTATPDTGKCQRFTATRGDTALFGTMYHEKPVSNGKAKNGKKK